MLFLIIPPPNHHHANLVDGGGAGKERLAQEHLGEDAAETPHVHAHCVPLRGKQDFWCSGNGFVRKVVRVSISVMVLMLI